MRAIAKQEASALIQSQSSIGLYATKSIPWQAVDLPLVTVFPASPQDRDEVNLYSEDDGTVSRWVWSHKFNAWLIIGGGPTGVVGWTATSSPPAGALVADGQAVTSAHPRLRNMLLAASSPYGTSGDDPLTPDLVNNFVVGSGDTYSLADTGGAATVTLVTGNMPAHTHSTPDHSHSFTLPATTSGAVAENNPGTQFGEMKYTNTAGTTSSYAGSTTSSDGASTTGSSGSGTAHENLPPYVALTPIIWT